MSDFYSNSFGLFTGLFAALFGMSYPLVLQCIQRIDEKYESLVISSRFEKEWPYHCFLNLLWPYLILVCASPFVMGLFVNHERLSYCFQSFMIVYVLVIGVVMVLLFKKITIYYNINKLVNTYTVTNPNRDVLFCFDLARYASKKGYQETYINAMVKVAECFIIENKKTDINKPVEYSENLKGVLLEIGRSLENNTESNSGYKSTDIISVLFNSIDEHIISDGTYKLVWFMLNNAAEAGNNIWIKDYWTWASQYYQFLTNKVQEGVFNPEMKKFYRFNVMLGAVLVFNKRYGCLNHIMNVCPNVSDKYPLIPGTFSKILEIAKELDNLMSKPMSIQAAYTIKGLYNGVNTDKAIFAEACKYLAILYIRLWSYRDYNYNYCNPIDPPVHPTSIDENEKAIRIIGVIRKHITNTYEKQIIDELDLKSIPKIEELLDTIDGFIESCNYQNKLIFEQSGHDKIKLKHIYDEAVIVNSASFIEFPVGDEMVSEEGTNGVVLDIIEEIDVEREYLHFGTKKECGGIGNGLSMKLNLTLKQQFYDVLVANFIVEQKVISHRDLQQFIDGLPLDNVLIDFTSGIDYETTLKRYNIGRILIDNVIFVCGESDVPTCEIVDGTFPDSELLDEYNYLYGSIEEYATNYKVYLKQRMVVKLPKDKQVAAIFIIE